MANGNRRHAESPGFRRGLLVERYTTPTTKSPGRKPGDVAYFGPGALTTYRNPVHVQSRTCGGWIIRAAVRLNLSS